MIITIILEVPLFLCFGGHYTMGPAAFFEIALVLTTHTLELLFITSQTKVCYLCLGHKVSLNNVENSVITEYQHCTL